MSDNQVINLGGNKAQKQAEQSNNGSFKTEDGQEIPSQFIDNEFIVPTDDVQLPSEGLFYANGKKSVKIKYLTAEDENILTSPELIKNGKVLDVLLEKAIVDNDLSADEMLTGDRNAVLLALRSTGYGDEYEVKMSCPECSEEYKTSVALSSLKHKGVQIKPDVNGEFEVELPKTKWNVKFRLLNGKDENYLTKKNEQLKKLKTKAQYSSMLTERYVLQLMEVAGNRDKLYISKAVRNMPIADSLFLREFIKEVEPGVDMEHEFECKNCGHVYEDTVPITVKLFWPNAKI